MVAGPPAVDAGAPDEVERDVSAGARRLLEVGRARGSVAGRRTFAAKSSETLHRWSGHLARERLVHVAAVPRAEWPSHDPAALVERGLPLTQRAGHNDALGRRSRSSSVQGVRYGDPTGASPLAGGRGDETHLGDLTCLRGRPRAIFRVAPSPSRPGVVRAALALTTLSLATPPRTRAHASDRRTEVVEDDVVADDGLLAVAPIRAQVAGHLARIGNSQPPVRDDRHHLVHQVERGVVRCCRSALDAPGGSKVMT